MDNDKITYFAETDSRNKRTPFGIKAEDRTRHVYVIGKTGMGKSTMLENMAVQDIQTGEGMVFIDPHGNTADLMMEYIPEHRVKDVIYFAPFDTEYPISLNVLEDVDPDKRHLVVTGLMSAFKKIWVDAWSSRMEHILANTLFALLEYPGATLLGVNRMFADKDYRKKVVENITDPSVKSYWTDEFAKYTEKYVQEATPAIQNKIGQFTGNPLIRNIIGQAKSSLDLRKVMDEKKILIVNLSKGRLGEGNANLLGSMFITKIYLAAMSRADLTSAELEKKPTFYMYVDEFQSFANESFADILSEARKYKLSLTIAHQYIEQMGDEVRAAVFGNVGTMVTFRIGAYDAEVLEREFAPVFEATDMVALGKYQIYLKLMIDGVGSHPFSATTLPPIALPSISRKDISIESSRAMYAKPKLEVEEEIREWYKPIEPTIKQKPKDGPDTRTQDERPSLKATVKYVPKDASYQKNLTKESPEKKVNPRDEHGRTVKPSQAEEQKNPTPKPVETSPRAKPVEVQPPQQATEEAPALKKEEKIESVEKTEKPAPRVAEKESFRKQSPSQNEEREIPKKKPIARERDAQAQTPPPPQKSISLSSLKPNNPRQIVDNKKQASTPNRDGLKNALADALAQAKKEEASKKPYPAKAPARQPDKQEDKKPTPKPQIQAPPHKPQIEHTTFHKKEQASSAFSGVKEVQPPSTPSSGSEVPEDVLRKILE